MIVVVSVTKRTDRLSVKFFVSKNFFVVERVLLKLFVLKPRFSVCHANEINFISHQVMAISKFISGNLIFYEEAVL